MINVPKDLCCFYVIVVTTPRPVKSIDVAENYLKSNRSERQDPNREKGDTPIFSIDFLGPRYRRSTRQIQ